MKFYRYKQVQRLTLFGFDDVYKENVTSLSKKSPQSTTAGVVNDTKLLRFDINRLYQTQLSDRLNPLSPLINSIDFISVELVA